MLSAVHPHTQTVVDVQPAINLDDNNVYSNSPASAPLCEGSTLHLYAPSGGLTYQWLKDQDSELVSDDQNPVFYQCLATAAGDYFVLITNACSPDPVIPGSQR